MLKPCHLALPNPPCDSLACAAQVKLQQHPAQLLAGELHRCVFSMRNSGAAPLHSIRLLVSHPDVHVPTRNDELQQTAADVLLGRLLVLLRHLRWFAGADEANC